MKKRGIRYLRFSSKDQSNYSIEWQDMNTLPWFERNSVELIDTFIDKGKSAKTFDRPDMQKLTEFITQYHRSVDYLVVDRMDRFSRDAGEAMTTVKMLQRKYAVQIVSVSEGITYDYYDNDSFLRTGLSFLFAEEENRKRANNIRGGIYTAKKKEGRYLGRAPVGYKNSLDGKKPILLIDEVKAPIVQHIYQSFLNDVPMYLIMKDAKSMGLTNTGNSAIARILTSPIYTGLLLVKSYKEHPEELVEGIHPALINRTSWYEVQNKLKPGKAVQIINDDFPLRSVLLCHCGRPITGAKSKGKLGKYYDYYKCQDSKHNNISTKKAHGQLVEAFGYMSLPDHLYSSILEKSDELLETKMKSDASMLRRRRGELMDTEKRLLSIETKWIADQIAYDTYQRHYTNLTAQVHSLKAEIDRLSSDQNDIWNLMHQELYKLKSLPDIYNVGSTIEKQQMVRMVFDSRLYYQDNIYRTPFIIDVLSHNPLILKEKQLLVLEEKTGLAKQIPCGRLHGFAIEPLIEFLSFLHHRVA
jgi:site-specific DNA recombinase